MKDNHSIRVEWCENFIRSVFAKNPFEDPGIEVNLFWDKAEESGLWERDTYGTPMSKALGKLTRVETVHDEEGNFCYNVFKLARKEVCA